MMAGKEVAKKAESAVAEFNPAMFEADAHLGLKNLDQEDMALPFLKIVSGLDPILDEREDVRKGDIVNTVTGEVYKGKDGIRVIPCAYQRKFIQWSPAALEAERLRQSIILRMRCRRPSVTPTTTRNILLTVRATISNRLLSGT